MQPPGWNRFFSWVVDNFEATNQPLWFQYAVNILVTTILIAGGAAFFTFLSWGFSERLTNPTRSIHEAVYRAERKIRARYPRAPHNAYGAFGEELIKIHHQFEEETKRLEKRRHSKKVLRLIYTRPHVAAKAPEAARSGTASRSMIDEYLDEFDAYLLERRQACQRLLDDIFINDAFGSVKHATRNARIGFAIHGIVRIIFLPAGGYILLVSGRNPLVWIQTLLRPLALALATMIVLWSRPIDGAVDWISNRWTDILDWVEGTTPTRLLPLLLLLVALVLLGRRSPLIDQIRARDEAAKDTNKLLAQLLGQLIPLTAELYVRRDELKNDFYTDLRQFVRDASGGQMTYNYDGLLPISQARSGNLIAHEQPRPNLNPDSAERLAELLDKVIDVQKEILDKGLTGVAYRLTAPCVRHITTCGLLPGWIEPRKTTLNERLCTPEYMDARRRKYLRQASGTGALSELYRGTASYNADRLGYIGKMSVTIVSMETAVQFLQRRITGKWWLQILSIAAK